MSVNEPLNSSQPSGIGGCNLSGQHAGLSAFFNGQYFDYEEYGIGNMIPLWPLGHSCDRSTQVVLAIAPVNTIEMCDHLLPDPMPATGPPYGTLSQEFAHDFFVFLQGVDLFNFFK